MWTWQLGWYRETCPSIWRMAIALREAPRSPLAIQQVQQNDDRLIPNTLHRPVRIDLYRSGRPSLLIAGFARFGLRYLDGRGICKLLYVGRR